jgi:hypothetical protein
MNEQRDSFGELPSAREPEQRVGDMLTAYDGLRSELALLMGKQRTRLVEENIDTNAIYEGQRQLNNLMRELWRIELQISTTQRQT